MEVKARVASFMGSEDLSIIDLKFVKFSNFFSIQSYLI